MKNIGVFPKGANIFTSIRLHLPEELRSLECSFLIAMMLKVSEKEYTNR